MVSDSRFWIMRRLNLTYVSFPVGLKSLRGGGRERWKGMPIFFAISVFNLTQVVSALGVKYLIQNLI